MEVLKRQGKFEVLRRWNVGEEGQKEAWIV